MPGKTIKIGEKGKVNDENEPDKVGDRIGYLCTFDSKNKLEKLEEFMMGDLKDQEAIRDRLKALGLHIFNIIPDKNAGKKE